jgi:hypothetical protein
MEILASLPGKISSILRSSSGMSAVTKDSPKPEPYSLSGEVLKNIEGSLPNISPSSRIALTFSGLVKW